MTLRYVHGAQYAITASGEMISGSKLYFYLAGTSQGTPQDVFSDSGKTTPISQPVLADSAGRWPDIFMDDVIYDVVWKDGDGVTIDTFLNVDPGLSSALGNGSALPVNQGGTGATTAAAARTQLGVPSQSQVTDLSNDVSELQTQVATGLNVSDEFGALASKDDISTAELASGFGAIDLQAPVLKTTNANTSISATIPLDSSIPQVGEGTEILSQSFTPISASSTIVIDVCVQGGAASNNSVAAAIFRNGASDAVAAGSTIFANNGSSQVVLHYEESSGATSAITWSVRVGGTFTLNGNMGANTFGQKTISWIRIREVKAF